MPRTPVALLRSNMSLSKQQFLLREKSVTVTRAGSPMLHVTLADRTGSIAGVYFDVPGHVPESLIVGRGVEVTGRVGEYRDQAQITLERIMPAELAELAEFLPVASRPLEEMQEELFALRESIADPQLSRLLDAVFDDASLEQAFVQAPAAKYHHHACVGGLVQHSLGIARFVDAACLLYPQVDRDLAITTALLHDIGKIRAYDPMSFDLTEEGSLWTHLYMGASFVEHVIDGLAGFPPELRLRIVHAILGHHGKLENGSPTVPMTLEAIILHHADNLDAQVQGALDHFGRSQGDDAPFTDRSHMHDTRLYRGAGGTAPKQQSLW